MFKSIFKPKSPAGKRKGKHSGQASDKEEMTDVQNLLRMEQFFQNHR